jgi:transposase-like protein
VGHHRGDFVPPPLSQPLPDGVVDNVLSMHCLGMEPEQILTQLREIYGCELAPCVVADVIDSMVEGMAAWQERELGRFYPVLVIDTIPIAVADQDQELPVSMVTGVNVSGERDVLGFWPATAAGPAGCWSRMVSDLCRRGLADSLVICCDDVTGLPEAVRSAWPGTTVQSGLGELVRGSLARTARADWPSLTKQLRAVLTAADADRARARLDEFDVAWRDTHPAVTEAWRRSWTSLRPLLELPVAIREVVHTVVAQQALTNRYRRAVRVRGRFPSVQSAFDVFYRLTTQDAPAGTGRRERIASWPRAVRELEFRYPERVMAGRASSGGSALWVSDPVEHRPR